MQPLDDVSLYSRLLKSLHGLAPADFERDLLFNIPRLFLEAARPSSSPQRGYVRTGDGYHFQDLESRDRALFWNGAQLGMSEYPGQERAWSGNHADFAGRVVSLALRTGARTVLELGGGCGMGAFHAILAGRYKGIDLRLITLERDPDAVRCADFVKVCHGLAVESLCLDMAGALERSDDLVMLEHLCEGERVIFITDGALHPFYSDDQYRSLFDFVINDLPTVAGAHREALAFRTPSYTQILRALSAPPEVPAALEQAPSDPFRVLLGGGFKIKPVDRQEIMPHYLTAEFPSYLSWEV